jgi:hypothetical protein
MKYQLGQFYRDRGYDIGSIHLITSFPFDDKRIHEYGTCLRVNLLNPWIGEITVVTDSKGMSKKKALNDLLAKTKIRRISSRPKFNELFNIANESDEQLTIIANGDVFFDDTLRFVTMIDWQKEKRWLHITRREASWDCDLGHNYSTVNSSNQQLCQQQFQGSSDSWIFKTPISLFAKDVEIGTGYCDHMVSWAAEKNGYKVYNPCLDIAAWHMHTGRNSGSTVEEVETAETETSRMRWIEFNAMGMTEDYMVPYCKIDKLLKK